MLSKVIAKILVVGLLVLSIAGMAFAQLNVSPPLVVNVGNPGETISIPLTLSNPAGAGIDAFQFKFNYPKDYLNYDKLTKTGSLTESWANLDGQENVDGIITIGGFNTTATTGHNQTLFFLDFIVENQVGVGLLSITDFGDDLAGASTTNGTLNSTVPVELATFSAEVEENVITLSWTTISEVGNFGFDLERSIDGEVFEPVVFIPGKGTTNEPQFYTYEDKLGGASETYFYRLKQVDIDGSYDYSGALQVTLAAPESFGLSQNFPNPFNPETTISYRLAEATTVKLGIYNLKGQLIRSLVDESKPAGFHFVIWNGKMKNGADAPSGVYIYRLAADNLREMKQLTLVR